MQCSSKIFLILFVLTGCAPAITIQKDIYPYADQSFKDFFGELDQQKINIHTEKDPTYDVEYIIVTDGYTIANFSRGTAGRTLSLIGVTSRSYSDIYPAAKLPDVCSDILLEEHMALEEPGPIYPHSNATHVGVGSYRKDITINKQTGEAIFSQIGSATSATYFVHSKNTPQFYGKIITEGEAALQQWLSAHTNYNPPWKPEIIKLHACFREILSQ